MKKTKMNVAEMLNEIENKRQDLGRVNRFYDYLERNVCTERLSDQELIRVLYIFLKKSFSTYMQWMFSRTDQRIVKKLDELNPLLNLKHIFDLLDVAVMGDIIPFKKSLDFCVVIRALVNLHYDVSACTKSYYKNGQLTKRNLYQGYYEVIEILKQNLKDGEQVTTVYCDVTELHNILYPELKIKPETLKAEYNRLLRRAITAM